MKKKLLIGSIIVSFLLVSIVLASIWEYEDSGELVLDLDFDDCSLLDDSSYGNNGTNNGATCTNKGKYKQAYEFDGVDDYIIENVANWQGGDSQGTISAWIKLNALGSEVSIFSSTDFAVTNKRLQLGVTATNYISIIQDNASTKDEVRGNTLLTTGKWYHVVVNSNSSDYVLYLNGRKETLTILSGSNNGDWFAEVADRDNWVIGAWYISAGILRDFNGSIDQVRIYNRSLTASEIKELYNESLTSGKFIIRGSGEEGLVNETGLVSEWKFDGNALDSIGSNDGTVTGATLTNKGKFKQAYEFDGTDDEIDIDGSDASFAIVDGTISFWLYADVVDDTFFSISKNVTDRVLMYYDAGNIDVYWDVNDDGITLAGAIPVVAEKWYFFTLTFGSGGVKTYVDGVLDKTNAVTTGFADIASADRNPLSFGLDCNGCAGAERSWFNGTIDQVRIYNRSLTASEVRELYNESKKSNKFILRGNPSTGGVQESSMVGWWDLNGNANDKALSNDGTVTGAVVTNKGKFKQAYSFDGIDDCITIDDDESLDVGVNLTITAWVYRLTVHGGSITDNIFTRIFDSGIAGYLFDIGYNSKLRFVVDGDWGTDNDTFSDSLISTGVWTHVAVTFNGDFNLTNGEVNFYIDGQLDDTDYTSAVFLPNEADSARIGCRSGQYFNGTMDEVVIWNVSLSASEVNQLYNESKKSNKFIIRGNPSG